MGEYTITGSKKVEDYKDIDSRCIVKFRPGDDWEGQYGFDWFREGDYGEKGRTNSRVSSHYKDDNNSIGLIGKYGAEIDVYSANSVQRKFKTEAYMFKYRNRWYANDDQIGQLYFVDPHIQDRMSDLGGTLQIKNDQIVSGKNINAVSYADDYYKPLEIKENVNTVSEKMAELFGSKSKQRDNYYVPSISLFYKDYLQSGRNPCEAKVKLMIHAENILVLDFFVDEGIKGVKLNPCSIVIDGDYDKDDKTLTITLTDDFKYNVGDVSIGVLATHKSHLLSSKIEKTFAGKLNVVKFIPKNVDVVIVPILTRQNSGIPVSQQNILIETEKKNLKRFFAQANVVPLISEIRIRKTKSLNEIQSLITDATDDNNEIHLHDIQRDSLGQILRDGRGEPLEGNISLHVEFERLFNKERNLSQKIKNAYKVFLIFGDGYGVHGQAAGFPDSNPVPPKNVIVFNNPPDHTSSHELFHRFGLRHSFDNTNIYTFVVGETSNIMDRVYRLDRSNNPYHRFSLWRWQWEKIRGAEGMEDIESDNYNV